jgi:hypothetical protein
VFGPVSQWIAPQTAALLTIIIDLLILTLTRGCDALYERTNCQWTSGVQPHSHSVSRYQTGCSNMKNRYILVVVFAVVCTGRNMWLSLVDRHIHSGNTTHRYISVRSITCAQTVLCRAPVRVTCGQDRPVLYNTAVGWDTQGRPLGRAIGALAPGADFEGAPKRRSPTGHTLIRSTVAW